MKKPTSFPRRKQPGAPPKAEESLDFTHGKPAKPPARPESTDRYKAGRSRRGVVLALIVIAIAIVVVVVVAVSQDSSPPPVTSEATPAPSPPEIQTAPALPPTQSQPQGSAPQSVDTHPIPAEFLKKYEQYVARPGGGKAIALALDVDGSWAHGTVSGAATQSEADEEALSVCARYQKEAGVQENCRLFASGDKMVW